MDLNKRMPPAYKAEPRVHLVTAFEIDVAALERKSGLQSSFENDDSGGGIATAFWAPPEPTLIVDAQPADQDEYEVKVFDRHRRLVAAVEIVSPANKDRPENRQQFVGKCAALLRRGVSVSIVDLVTERSGNLYMDLLELLGETDSSFSPDAPSIYATTCRYRHVGEQWKLEIWAHPLQIGRALPTLPLWLASDRAVPLDLEQTYRDTCAGLRMAPS